MQREREIRDFEERGRALKGVERFNISRRRKRVRSDEKVQERDNKRD